MFANLNYAHTHRFNFYGRLSGYITRTTLARLLELIMHIFC